MNDVYTKIDDYMIIEHGINCAAHDLGIERLDFGEYYQASYDHRRELIMRFLSAAATYQKWFSRLLPKLEDFEKLLYATDKFYRDHVLHTFRVWGLGLYLYYNGLESIWPRSKTRDFYLTWYIASIYHDVGYPIAELKKLEERLNGSLDYTNTSAKVVDFGNCVSFLDDQFINETLRKLRVQRGISLLEEPHGLISTRLVIHALIEEIGERWHPAVKPALVAIADHTSEEEIEFMSKPFSALLVICDELQEWGRPYITSVLGERYISTDHIELRVDCGPSIQDPTISVKIDYTKTQSDLHNVLKWKGEDVEDSKNENLDRLRGINVNPEMRYFRLPDDAGVTQS